MRGSRDSELCLRLVDPSPDVDGSESGLVRQFRMRLMNRHSGRPDASQEFREIWDPNVAAKWRGVGWENTILLSDSVPGIPTDSIGSLAQWRAKQARSSAPRARAQTRIWSRVPRVRARLLRASVAR